jgi:3-hydroxymyristoyl/3-hydroxydecanoyl-(acyl carrier protein) dehydratase
MVTVERVFARDLPAAAGHFPGNPIIPGAVLLSETLEAIEAHLGVVLPPCQIKAAKFFSPARPGDCLRIEFSDDVTQTIKFTCKVGERTIVTGAVTCGAV